MFSALTGQVVGEEEGEMIRRGGFKNAEHSPPFF